MIPTLAFTQSSSFYPIQLIMRDNTLRQFKEFAFRIFGTYSFTASTFLAAAIPAGILNALADPSVGSRYRLAWVVIVASATVISGLFFVLAGKFAPSSETKFARIFFGLALFLATGALRGGLLGWLGSVSSVASEVNWQFRLIGGAMVGLLLFSLSALFVNDFMNYRRTLSSLIQNQSRITRLTRDAQTELDRDRTRLVMGINTQVNEAVQAISAETTPGQSLEKYKLLVTQLLEIAEKVIRPLSQQLIETTQPEVQPASVEHVARINIARWMNSSTIVRPFWPLPITVMWALVGATTITALNPGFPGLLAYPVFVLSTWALLYLAEVFVSTKLPQLKFALRVSVITLVFGVVAIVPALLSWVLLADVSRHGAVSLELTLLVLDPIATFLLCVIFASLAGLDAERKVILSRLAFTNNKLEWELATLRGQLRAQRKELSRTVHGDVQSIFIAMALKLQTAISQDQVSSQTLEEIVAELRTVTDFSYSSKQLPPLKDSLNEIKSLWGHAVDISWDIEPFVMDLADSQVILRSMLIDVCSEAVTNAIKHGNATLIDISMSHSENYIHLRIENNGEKQKSVTSEGAGLGLYSEVAIDYELENTSGGVMLTMRIPAPLKSSD